MGVTSVMDAKGEDCVMLGFRFFPLHYGDFCSMWHRQAPYFECYPKVEALSLILFLMGNVNIFLLLLELRLEVVTSSLGTSGCDVSTLGNVKNGVQPLILHHGPTNPKNFSTNGRSYSHAIKLVIIILPKV